MERLLLMRMARNFFGCNNTILAWNAKFSIKWIIFYKGIMKKIESKRERERERVRKREKERGGREINAFSEIMHL